jgi:hypothetical protein
MLKYPSPSHPTATLQSPRPRLRPTGSAQDEIHCTLCDCSEFRQSRIATICTCGHHFEDHETPDATRPKGARF